MATDDDDKEYRDLRAGLQAWFHSQEVKFGDALVVMLGLCATLMARLTSDRAKLEQMIEELTGGPFRKAVLKIFDEMHGSNP
jgi:hypothetical protein